MNQRLSHTELGQGWIRNFAPPDHATATVLLDSLRIVSYGEFRSRLISVLTEEISQNFAPTCLYQVRAPRLQTRETDGWRWTSVIPEPDVDRPLAGKEGSELTVGNIVRDVRTDLQARQMKVSNYLSLAKLRSNRVRRIVLVDDYAGSGDAALRCISAWRHNPTIRSWTSLGLLRISYVAFAISPTALDRIDRALQRSGGTASCAEIGRDFTSADWTSSQYDNVVRLCQRYARKADEALGWSETASLLLLPHSTSNNLPAVFTQTKGRHGQQWLPIAARRSRAQRSPEVADQSYLPHVSLSRAAARTNQLRLSETIDQIADEMRARIVVALGAIVRHKVSPEYIADILRTSRRNAELLLATMTELGLIDAQSLKLTDLGWAELRQARRRRSSSSWPNTSPPIDTVYYPTSLRRGRDV